MHLSGDTPTRDAAIRYTAGSGFPLRTSSAETNTLKKVGCGQSLKDYFDIRTRRCRGDCLQPSLLVKPVYPVGNTG
jgi:hypothetical protein